MPQNCLFLCSAQQLNLYRFDGEEMMTKFRFLESPFTFIQEKSQKVNSDRNIRIQDWNIRVN